jgi:BsuBI/PstI restriction endonuclease HTH domain
MTNRNNYIEVTQQIIVLLGLPRAQQNERSALCLLALINLTPKKSWSNAENPLIGITPIMNWARKHYNKEYAPNTRETIRRQTMHQFCDAGIAIYNPDKPDRIGCQHRFTWQNARCGAALHCQELVTFD